MPTEFVDKAAATGSADWPHMLQAAGHLLWTHGTLHLPSSLHLLQALVKSSAQVDESCTSPAVGGGAVGCDPLFSVPRSPGSVFESSPDGQGAVCPEAELTPL